MTVQNLGTKTTLLALSPNDVVAASANRTGVDLVDYEGDIMLSWMLRPVALASPTP